jgi:hypothetical protein
MRYFEHGEDLEEYSLAYLDYIRTLNCCVTGHTIADPHHLEPIGMGNDRNKPSLRHFTCVPLCREMHTELHAKGIHWFQERYRIQLWQEAFYILAKWLITQKKFDKFDTRK